MAGEHRLVVTKETLRLFAKQLGCSLHEDPVEETVRSLIRKYCGREIEIISDEEARSDGGGIQVGSVIAHALPHQRFCCNLCGKTTYCHDRVPPGRQVICELCFKEQVVPIL